MRSVTMHTVHQTRFKLARLVKVALLAALFVLAVLYLLPKEGTLDSDTRGERSAAVLHFLIQRQVAG